MLSHGAFTSPLHHEGDPDGDAVTGLKLGQRNYTALEAPYVPTVGVAVAFPPVIWNRIVWLGCRTASVAIEIRICGPRRYRGLYTINAVRGHALRFRPAALDDASPTTYMEVFWNAKAQTQEALPFRPRTRRRLLRAQERARFVHAPDHGFTTSSCCFFRGPSSSTSGQCAGRSFQWFTKRDPLPRFAS